MTADLSPATSSGPPIWESNSASTCPGDFIRPIGAEPQLPYDQQSAKQQRTDTTQPTQASPPPSAMPQPGQETEAPPCKQPRLDNGTTPPPPTPTVIFFKCPRCPHKISGIKPAFSQMTLDSRLWCNSCQRSLFVRHWQCSCGIPWHACPTHGKEPSRIRALLPAQGIQHKNADAAKPPPRPRQDKQLGQGKDTRILHWLDQPSHKRQRCNEPRDVDLETYGAASTPLKRPNINCLGPKLLAKFPRLVQEHTQLRHTSTSLDPQQQSQSQPSISPPASQAQEQPPHEHPSEAQSISRQVPKPLTSQLAASSRPSTAPLPQPHCHS